MPNCRRQPRHVALSFLVCLILSVMSGDARCEGFIDAYGGWTVGGKTDVTVSETRASGTRSAATSGDLSSAPAIGMRLGAWFPSHGWLGLGMDIGYLDAEGPGLHASILPLSFFLAVRAPLLATPDVPSGRLQPYAMAGLTTAVVDISVAVDGIGGSSTQGCLPFGYGGCDDTVLGPYLVGGVAWQPARNVAFFAEYRHSSFSVDYETTNSLFFPTANGKVDASVSMDHVMLGISYRFDPQGAVAPQDSPQTGLPAR